MDDVKVGATKCATILAPAPEQGAFEGAVVQQAVLQRVIDGCIGDVLPLPLAELQPKGTFQSDIMGILLDVQHIRLETRPLQLRCGIAWRACGPLQAQGVCPWLQRLLHAPQSMCEETSGPVFPSCLQHSQKLWQYAGDQRVRCNCDKLHSKIMES